MFMKKGRIKKEIPNNHLFDEQPQEENENVCCDCPHGFFVSTTEILNPLHIFHIYGEDALED